MNYELRELHEFIEISKQEHSAFGATFKHMINISSYYTTTSAPFLDKTILWQDDSPPTSPPLNEQTIECDWIG